MKRLIDTETLQLHKYSEIDVPRRSYDPAMQTDGYAILSHRWMQGEISYQDVQLRQNLQAPGWQKIERFCAYVRELGFRWAWVDTCCIDKTRSAELSEAVNSMYRWYRKAEACFVYLDNVRCHSNEVTTYKKSYRSSGRDNNSTVSTRTVEALSRSKWCTRCWHLQELIAPDDVVFLDNTWSIFGSKITLEKPLSDITGITDLNSRLNRLLGQSVANKMSWAYGR